MIVTTSTPSAGAARAAGPAPGSTSRRLAHVSLGAAAVAAAAIAIAGFLDPGYSRTSEAISALASRESGAAPVMIVGFLAMAVTLLAAGTALFRTLPTKRAKAGSVLVVLAGLLTVVAGVARQSCSSLQAECLARESAGTVSASHWVHNLVSLPLFLFLVVAGFLWGAGLARLTGSQGLARVTLLVAVTGAVFFVWFGSDAFGSYGGLVERVLVWLTFGWPTYLALRATRHAADAA